MDEEGLPDEEVQPPSCCNSTVSGISFTRYLFLQKVMRRSQHARKETEFLRLKRTRLGLDDFESLKVIGRGAFGEVRELEEPGLHSRVALDSCPVITTAACLLNSSIL